MGWFAGYRGAPDDLRAPPASLLPKPQPIPPPGARRPEFTLNLPGDACEAKGGHHKQVPLYPSHPLAPSARHIQNAEQPPDTHQPPAYRIRPRPADAHFSPSRRASSRRFFDALTVPSTLQFIPKLGGSRGRAEGRWDVLICAPMACGPGPLRAKKLAASGGHVWPSRAICVL